MDKELLKRLKRKRTIFQSVSPEIILNCLFGCIGLGYVLLICCSVVVESEEISSYLIITFIISLIFMFIGLSEIEVEEKIKIFINFIEKKQAITAVEFLLKIKEKVLKEDYDRFFDYIQSKNLFDKNINECFQQCEIDIERENEKKLRNERIKKIEAEKKKKILLATMIRNNKNK